MPDSSKDLVTGASIDRFFTLNYAEISRWAMEIASYDRSVSEDLIHDAYLKLLRSRSKLQIDDPNAYVYVAIRNTFRSQLRRRSIAQVSQPFVDLDRGVDPNRMLKVFDALTEVCDFSCSRRRNTIAASLFILRYFLGYPPTDLSKIANRSRAVIDTRLATFRRELHSHSTAMDFRPVPLNGEANVWGDTGLQERFRQRVFRTKEGSCISATQLKRAFKWNSGGPDREELAHLASCQKCLESANRMLHIDGLGRRNPMDAVHGEAFVLPFFVCTLSILVQVGSACVSML